jgi:hypothetical protein
MAGTTPQTNPSTDQKATRVARTGDKVVLRGWTLGEEALHGVIASAIGMRANIAYLSRMATWLNAYSVPYDAAGESPGSWRWAD